ncbi:ribonuclease HII [Nocardioides sp. CER19]|uniref:ribonuclease HII n=1 Tax=Nocardioides sp. CER19 TaxID=3038538 RepID=UPI0024472B7F|nr:ribonuclease HII [Nocardioides sp. CER19]MDH2416893.1 ribonuclease HII [Nocardioides sp. CER19]
MSAAPTLRFERTLLRGGVRHLAACDEVGRGALCGPVTIGVVVISETTRTAPQGVRDSKLLTPEARQRLVPKIQRWAACWAVGHATPGEIDEFGIIPALRLAGHRALAQLSIVPDQVLLDGNHDYLTPPAPAPLVEPVEVPLFDVPVAPAALPVAPALDELIDLPPVLTRIKADLTCAAVAAASILAKTARDALMVELDGEHPEYGWLENKGYSAPAHIDALARFGPTTHHRRSWSLPGVTSGLESDLPVVVPGEGPVEETA